ncbi:MAG: metallophosphoesterase [Chloroflexi bacterium]|nr:metallophosphoesterase [Chloroflexota bacterium]
MIRLLISLSALGIFAVGAYGYFIEPYRLRVRRIRLPIPSLNSPDATVRILHITDLHMRAEDKRRVRMLQQLAYLEPDLLLLTGDLIHGGRNPDAEIETVLEALAPIHARHGVFAVLGNHDHVHRHRIKSWFGQPHRFHDTTKLVHTLESQQVHVLTNAHANVTVNGQPLTLVGVDDPFTWLDDIRRATNGAPDDTTRLLLAHTPDVVRTLHTERFDLILCGHTHGGQVRLAENIVWHTNTRVPLPRNAGLMQVGGHLIYCSAGVGVSMLPIRLNCPPEVGWIELVAAKQDDPHTSPAV